MVQGDQAGASGSSNQGGGGKRKNRNRNRNKNKNKQTNNTAQSQPGKEESPNTSPVPVEPSIQNVPPPTSLPSSISTEQETIVAQHQLPIFDSSIGTFRPTRGTTSNTFLPSFASDSTDVVLTEESLLSATDSVPPNDSFKTSEENQDITDDSNVHNKEGLENKVIVNGTTHMTSERERNDLLVNNLKIELKSRPYISNLPSLKDAEMSYVNSQIQSKKKDGIINGSNGCHGDKEPDVVRANPSIHQDNTNIPQMNKTLQQREKELVANMKLEMANDPYMAYWAQIKDAEHRVSSRCKLETNSGGILPKVFRQSSKGSKKKVSLGKNLRLAILSIQSIEKYKNP